MLFVDGKNTRTTIQDGYGRHIEKLIIAIFRHRFDLLPRNLPQLRILTLPTLLAVKISNPSPYRKPILLNSTNPNTNRKPKPKPRRVCSYSAQRPCIGLHLEFCTINTLSCCLPMEHIFGSWSSTFDVYDPAFKFS